MPREMEDGLFGTGSRPIEAGFTAKGRLAYWQFHERAHAAPLKHSVPCWLALSVASALAWYRQRPTVLLHAAGEQERLWGHVLWRLRGCGHLP